MITLDEGELYLSILRKFRYGPHPLVEAAPIKPNVEYNLAVLSGGGPYENVSRLAIAGACENIQDIAALTGQRLRSVWDIDGEESPQALLGVTGQATGTDMDELTKHSP